MRSEDEQSTGHTFSAGPLLQGARVFRLTDSSPFENFGAGNAGVSGAGADGALYAAGLRAGEVVGVFVGDAVFFPDFMGKSALFGVGEVGWRDRRARVG